jgi:hypothetical protein
MLRLRPEYPKELLPLLACPGFRKGIVSVDVCIEEAARAFG